MSNDDHAKERVLCVRREDAVRVLGEIRTRIESAEWDRHFDRLAWSGSLVPRSECETDESLLQLIPYAILCDVDNRVLTYRRGKAGGDSRLHGLRSIGIGGHVNEAGGISVIDAAVYRELLEETGLLPDSVLVMGVICSDATPVDRVHLGLVFEAHIQRNVSPTFAPEIADPRWERMEDLDAAGFENWSRILIEHFQREATA